MLSRWLRHVFSSDYSGHVHSCMICPFVGSSVEFDAHVQATGHRLVSMARPG